MAADQKLVEKDKNDWVIYGSKESGAKTIEGLFLVDSCIMVSWHR